MAEKVAVIGAGSWGTAVAGLVARHAHEVTLWAHSQEVADGINRTHVNPRYLTGYELPAHVRSTTSLADAATGAEAVFVVTPSSHVRSTCEGLSGAVSAMAPVAVLAKGIEFGSAKTMTEVASEGLGGHERICALSGPNHAEEVCRGMISAAVVASRDAAAAEQVRSLVIDRTFRAYVTDDVVGVETCAAVKNVVAIACGVAAGMGLGDNTLAVIMTRGLAEIGRFVADMGGNPLTCMGLAGMGDLIATCTSRHSRNRTFGEALARGSSLEEYERATLMVVEGARAAQSVSSIADERGIEAPITYAVRDALSGERGVNEIMEGLLRRLPHDEFYGFDE